MKIKYFVTQSALRKWYEKNFDKEDELWLGFYKKGTGKPSVTWPESVDEALCFGWIDGIRKSIDEERYMIRFTPRRKGSIWSAVNRKKIKELNKAGLVKPSGLTAFKQLDEKRSRIYSFEQGKVQISEQYENQIKANKKAWGYFQNLPPSAKRPSIWYVMSAKREDTREKRLELLIKCSEQGKRIPQLDITRKK